jgi:hypothetical protein
MAETGADSVIWVDFHFNAKKKQLDSEREGLDFLPEDDPVRRAWTQYWPQRGTQQNWNAVGIATTQGVKEWLLVEAKAHETEVLSDCGAEEHGGLPQIRKALDDLKLALGVPKASNWLRGHYQLANRLAALSFLNRSGAPARLILIYFYGDKRPDSFRCPASEAAWTPLLDQQARALGLEHEHLLSHRVHKLFLPVIDAR